MTADPTKKPAAALTDDGQTVPQNYRTAKRTAAAMSRREAMVSMYHLGRIEARLELLQAQVRMQASGRVAQ